MTPLGGTSEPLCVSWRLVSAPRQAIIGKWTKLHVYNPKTGRTACGLIPRVGHESHSHEGRCARCFR